MMPSAIITNYNYGKFLTTSIAAVLRQGVTISEVVIVDDGSVDESRDVLAELATRYPGRLVPVFQANGGQAAAMNAGLTRCTGDIICMLDADDLWHPTKVERVLAAFAAEPDAVMVMHRYDFIDPDGRVVEANGTEAFPGGSLDSLMVETGGQWVFGATSSLSLRRSALERILPIPAERWRLCADGAIAYPAAFLGTVVSLDEVLGSYRIHGSNNHYAAGLDPDKVQADVEMTNRYLNEFLERIGRPERVDLSRNLSYRRDRFYRHGGGPGEAWAIAKLICQWPLYDGPAERAKYLARFLGRTVRGSGRRRRPSEAPRIASN